MNNQFLSCVQYDNIRVEQMRSIRNLIEVKISDEQLKAANFSDGIKLSVKSIKPVAVNAFWIVKIRDMVDIEKDWRTMRDELWDNRFLADGSKSMFQNQPQIYQQSNEEILCDIKPPSPIDTSTMTVLPRDFYPLVVIVTCYEEEPNPQAQDAAANIHIIHIKDAIVPIESHVIKQYIKQINGGILDITQRRIFNEETEACFICFEEANPVGGLKLFCLFPCRHSPICSNCIKRIRECPKCRYPIGSVFEVR